MSAFDGVVSPSEMIQQAVAFGHGGIAFADIDNVQAFPEIMEATSQIRKQHPNFKTIYGTSIK